MVKLPTALELTHTTFSVFQNLSVLAVVTWFSLALCASTPSLIYRFNFRFEVLTEKGGGPLRFDAQTPPEPSSPTLVPAPP